jgi:hypothetical protein
MPSLDHATTLPPAGTYVDEGLFNVEVDLVFRPGRAYNMAQFAGEKGRLLGSAVDGLTITTWALIRPPFDCPANMSYAEKTGPAGSCRLDGHTVVC